MSRFLRTLTYASVPALLVAAALIGATGVLLRVPISAPFVAAAMAGVWLVYLGERLVHPPEDAANHPGRTQWFSAHRRGLLAACVACTAVGVVAAPALRLPTAIGGAGLALAGAAYALPLFGRRLKTLPLVKPMLVGGVWAAATVVLPVVEARGPLGAAAWLLFGVRLLTVSANVLLHDWAERAGDRAARTGTIPPGWTWPHLRLVLAAMLGVALTGEVALAVQVGRPGWIDAAGPVLLAAALFREPRGGWQESLVLDLLVAWPLATVLGSG